MVKKEKVIEIIKRLQRYDLAIDESNKIIPYEDGEYILLQDIISEIRGLN